MPVRVLRYQGGMTTIIQLIYMSCTPVSVAAATAVLALQTCPGTAGRHHCSGAPGPAP